jgi:ABC-type transport system involved in multi-copper enzyme maturation permease subunit
VSRPGLLGLVRKEARALFLIWAGSAAACLAYALTRAPQLAMPGWLAYFVGSVALAAMTTGHEYTHGTLPTLLSLPVDRRRLGSAKLLAVMPMLITLGLLALAMGSGRASFERNLVIGALSVLAAVTLAPWLTMVCRSPLAGSVFALGIAGAMQLASLGVVMLWLKLGGRPTLPLETIGDRVLLVMLAAAAALGAVAGWRTFMQLEALDGRDPHLTWPRWLRSSIVLDEEQRVAPARRSRPYWLLVKKELRIQQMSLAVAGINVLIWLATGTFVEPSTESASVMAMVALLYGGLLAILIGALASAEERHMGTLEWQTLLPFAAWRQFAIKTAVALTLSLLLAFLLPLLLARGELAITSVHAGAVLALTLASLVVSSRCQSGLQAVTMAVSAIFAGAVLLGWSWSFFLFGVNTALAVLAALAVVGWWSAFNHHRMARS